MFFIWLASLKPPRSRLVQVSHRQAGRDVPLAAAADLRRRAERTKGIAQLALEVKLLRNRFEERGCRFAAAEDQPHERLAPEGHAVIPDAHTQLGQESLDHGPRRFAEAADHVGILLF